jgi:cellulose synthase/poly-beta-1,6-N-acetylglucosamine synthase-like glycosyltransferase
MRMERTWSLFAPLAGCALLAGWIVLSAAGIQAATFSLLLYGLANLIVYTDALDLLLRLYVRRRNTATSGAATESRHLSIDLVAALPVSARPIVPIQPYAIIASVYNLEDQLEEFIEAFAPYRDRVWLISDASTDNTLVRLRHAGWRCLDGKINRRKPGALRYLLERLPAHIETVMVVDPDIRIRATDEGSVADLEHVIGDFQQSGAAAVCPRVMIEPDGFLARFQAFEYALAFRIGRRSLADYSITSGVSIYRRDALERVLSKHSLSIYAEDLENAITLLSDGERIYYDGRLVVSTEGPGQWGRWFSQRVGWYFGFLKVYVERFREVRLISRRSAFAFYHFIVYMGGLSLALHLLKLGSVALLIVSIASGFDELFVSNLVPDGRWANPAYFATAIASYFVLGTIVLFTVVPKAERAYTAPIVPLYLLYALVHIAPMSVGFLNWFAWKLWGRPVYRDHYEPRRTGEHQPILSELQARRVW